MRYRPRLIEGHLRKVARQFAAVVVTGPRRAGKTTLLRHVFPSATYRLLEDPDVIARVRSDPHGFLDELRPPVILDEIQNAPELINYVRTFIDAAPRRTGRWFLTGSQESGLMRGVTESLAGRTAILDILPFSVRESPKVSVLRGGYPEVVARLAAADDWFAAYVRTYLERDVRAVTAVRDLATFRRFLALLASRCGRILNKTDIAAPLGVSVPTITQWISVLEVTGQILVIPPFYESLGKRLVKSPKVYFVDSGLAAHLLGIRDAHALESSPFVGALFEGFVASEIAKQQAAAGRRRELYYFRDHQGLEVDFVVPRGAGRLLLVEAKAGRTIHPRDADSLDRVARAAKRYRTTKVVVHRPRDSGAVTSALRPGVRAVGVEGLLESVL